MANKINPHHLVLIMHATYGSRKQDGAPRRLDTTDHILENPIGHGNNTDVQTVRLLDALSSLSVSKKEGQVVAIALQKEPTKKKINLIIAENGNVQEGLKTYIENIWGNLRKLSEVYQSSRQEGLDMDGSFLYLPSRVQAGLSLEVEIYKAISLHTLQKQLKRVKEPTESLVEFMEEVLKYRGHTYLEEFDENLKNFVNMADNIKHFLWNLSESKNKTRTYEEWNLIFQSSKVMSDEAENVLRAGDHFGCEKLADEVNLSRGMSTLLPIACRN